MIYTAVEKADTAGCFSSCPGGKTGVARNTSNSCWIRCFYNTVLGPKGAMPNATVAGMDVNTLIAAWNAPFASDDPTMGGCPPLPMAPEAGRLAVGRAKAAGGSKGRTKRPGGRSR